ncbi:hypothetical protein [Nitrosomonas supralitoralis]|uniref:Uncharacterized protein n=1 Tax=Nitrosomonas supralitoralis TaxID=2116706 RepID=A0A2P7NVQ4_9PROT|nr:hypothetical protein [Nitrosomonas supralitoralis]PSJ17519.1 hypothetical protein C7H79_07460 [Nitrosomonas supralitoralis]
MENKRELNDNEKIFVEKNDYESGFPMIGSMNFMPSGLPQKKNYSHSNFSKIKHISYSYGKYQSFIKYIPS